MSERDLLSLAAKAVGLRIVGWRDAHGDEVALLDDGTYWQPLHVNPLTDCMGDAMRLSVALKIDIKHHEDHVVGWFDGGFIGTGRIPYGDDPDAATRLAVVKAAAETARNLP